MLIITPKIIPSWLSSAIDNIVSFPGIALQEITQKAICALFLIPTYKHTYVLPNNKNRETKIIYLSYQALYMTLIPLLTNSLICALLTIPFSISFQTHNLSSLSSGLIDFLCAWVGIASGYYAIPSEEDIDELLELTQIEESNIWLNLAIYIIMLFSIPVIGFLCRIGYIISLAILMNKLIV